MRVRPATHEDWASMYPIFAGVVAEGETYAYPPDLTSEQAERYWTDGAHVVVAEEDPAPGSTARILGTARMGPNRPGRGSHVATASVMVGADARGRGVGRALGEHLIRWATDEGYRAIQFNAVVETNTTAVRLWHSLGFATVGTVPGAFDSASNGLVGLHVMHRTLP